MNLLETYKKRLTVSEKLYSDTHMGESMDNNKKLLVAALLQNTQKFLGEALEASNGTQRADLGLYKKFCVNLVNVAVPTLVSTELVITYPMTSMSGYVAYLEYSASTKKGATEQGDVFNSPFALKKVDSNYTGDAVVEETKASTKFTAAWTPIMKGVFVNEGKEYDYKMIGTDGAITYGNFAADGSIAAGSVVDGKVAYRYDNTIVPQNDLPRINAEMKNIPLLAKARRIAIYYSQLAAYQAKQDYGFDLNDSLSEQAVGRLAYEIDTEVIELLDETAGDAVDTLKWSKTIPVGVSKRDHYAGFAEVIEIAKSQIYQATQRFIPNYIIVASDILPVLSFIDNYNPSTNSSINGPYLAGTFGPLKVIVSPALESGRFLIGVNGNDLMSSVAVYAPYMPIVPTSLLQTADGGTTQGFSTLYDLKVLNPSLICAGAIEV